MTRYRGLQSVILACALAANGPAAAQVTRADYEHASHVREKYRDLAVNVPGPVNWIRGSDRFWYRKSVAGGNVFVVVGANKRTKAPAFDHERLAVSLSAAAGAHYTPLKLPFVAITFTHRDQALEFAAGGSMFRCSLADYSCKKTGSVPAGSGGPRLPLPQDDSPAEFGNDVSDGIVNLSPRDDDDESGAHAPEATSVRTRTSPDGKWEAQIRNYNVFIRAKGASATEPLSWDGSEGNYYTLRSVSWSPDSTRLVAYRVRPGYKRAVHYIESSPVDQLQPKYSSREYAKPGDTLDVAQPVLFGIAGRKAVPIEHSLFPNPYSLSGVRWWKDSRAFTFEYNQRGHQVYRVIEVDAQTARPRALISEESPTFIDYRPLIPNPHDTGKRVRFDLGDGKEMIWMSERDGWAHLYLYDGITGAVKNQITKGDWVVRAVEKVDEERRQIWFQASGMYPGQDPYLVHYYRINFDGTELTPLTDADADHQVAFSQDRQFYTDTFSRVDLPTVLQLRRTADRQVIMEVERADISGLLAAGWRAPEIFSAAGRDGRTGIWGILSRPANFDPSKKYPVVEAIYNGPQGSFVPKTFAPYAQPLTELGFVVAQIDGMGTNNRSKAFHDVAWKDLKDAGLPDRILWHQAVAAKYPWYDITRVGIFGNSAGGQNAMGALLFHPDFYKAAVANSGCHDNRMDKIWWNEQWMGWPVGPEYAASSNVVNAHLLRGSLLLIVGEMDTNVDPASTFQVVDALIKADKKFDLLYVPGGGHGAGGAYGQRLLEDFFVRHLLRQEPPDWNQP